MANTPKDVDWESIEADYRAGILSVQAIGRANGISGQAIHNRAKAENWQRDLAQRIHAAREARLARLAGPQTRRSAEDLQIVEANAQAQTDVIVGHRGDIQNLRKTVAAMTAELEASCNTHLMDALEEILEEKAKNSTAAQAAAIYKAYEAAMSLGGRSASAKNLVNCLATLIDKERQAFGIDKASSTGKQSLADFLESLS